MDLAATIQIFTDENEAAKQALAMVKERHARRRQTKEGTYRIKQQLVLGCEGCGWPCYYGRPLGGLGTGRRWYLLCGQSIILAMASTTAGSSASEGF